MDYVLVLARSDGLKLKRLYDGFVPDMQTCSFSLSNTLTDGLEGCGLLWCFYQLFGLSFWRHPFTTENPLVSNWCNVTFLQIWWRNKLIFNLDNLGVYFTHISMWTITLMLWAFICVSLCNRAVFHLFVIKWMSFTTHSTQTLTTHQHNVKILPAAIPQ